MTPSAWVNLSNDQLLKLRICDLNLRIEGSWLESQTKQLNAELAAKGFPFTPRYYLGDEWFSPEGKLAIAIPFYLAHPRLMQLEQEIMLEVEGGTPEWCMKLLRHEAGHCFDHAYRLEKRQLWKKSFGSPEKDYTPETYKPHPYSKAFVKHLDNWYAQAHPSEDFAETFAVWLSPNVNWKEEYKRWPAAIKKLKAVESMAQDCARRPPLLSSVRFGRLPYSVRQLRVTLDRYYQKRRKENADDYPDFYDSDLKKLFSGPVSTHGGATAERYLKKNQKSIIECVARWTGERHYTVQSLLKKLTKRCADLRLGLGENEARTHIEVAAYLAALVSNYLFTGKFKRKV